MKFTFIWWWCRTFNVVEDVLSIQASSVSYEQLFSTARMVINKTRNRLTSESICACVYLKNWLNEDIYT